VTDREMLEFAAKAAGIEYGWQHIYNDYEGSTSEEWDWNPRDDDGDAFRLACSLGLVVDFSRPSAAFPFSRHSYALSEGGNNTSATRLAILRAAAEVGRAMP